MKSLSQEELISIVQEREYARKKTLNLVGVEERVQQLEDRIERREFSIKENRDRIAYLEAKLKLSDAETG